MKYVMQLTIILAISLVGELMRYLIPLPIPASIYAMMIMFACLWTGLIPLSAVQDVGRFLIQIMPVFFVPSVVGILERWDAVAPIVVKATVFVVLSTIFVMVVSGKVCQAVIDRSSKEEER